MWYHLNDDTLDKTNTNSEKWFGLLTAYPENQPKLGYYAYQICAKILPGKTYAQFNRNGSTIPTGVIVYYLTGTDGSRVLVLWNDSATAVRDVTLKLSGTNHKNWNIKTGQSEDIESTKTFTLANRNTGVNSLIFLTWSE
jgi:hypothetical protein